MKYYLTKQEVKEALQENGNIDDECIDTIYTNYRYLVKQDSKEITIYSSISILMYELIKQHYSSFAVSSAFSILNHKKTTFPVWYIKKKQEEFKKIRCEDKNIFLYHCIQFLKKSYKEVISFTKENDKRKKEADKEEKINMSNFKKLSTEEILHLQSCLEFGFSDNDICAQLSNDDLNRIVKIYEFTYNSVAGIDFFFEQLDSFQETAVLFDSIKYILGDKIGKKGAIQIATSTTLMALSNRIIHRYDGLFHNESTIDMETIDINDFKENYPSIYQEIKESFMTLKEDEQDVCKRIYGNSMFMEYKYEDIKNIQKNGMKMDIKKKGNLMAKKQRGMVE